MRKSVARKFIFVTALALIIYTVFSVGVIAVSNLKVASDNLKSLVDYYSALLSGNDWSGPDWRDKLKELDDHVSVIDLNGNIIADSRYTSAQLGNQADLPEVKNAIKNEPNISIRNNPIDGRLTTYYAVRIHLGSAGGDVILRIASDWEFSNFYLKTIFPLVIAVLFLAIIISYYFTNSITQSALAPLEQIESSLEKINKGEYKNVAIESNYAEVKKLAGNINDISNKISNSLKSLHYEQTKSNFILQNIEQGFLAISKSKNIILANDAMKFIFPEYKNLLGKHIYEIIQDDAVRSFIDDAILSGAQNIGEITIDDAYYRVRVAPLDHQSEVKSASVLLLFTDITTERQYQDMRSEFFANASHELKTPLTAIKGFAELVNGAGTNKIVIEKCAEEIGKNATRMLNLINDMMTLTKLDTDIQDTEIEKVNLRALSEEIALSLSSIAEKRKITVKIEGQASLVGMRQQIEEMVSNLIDNALKYNHDGGYVHVRMRQNQECVFYEVEDNGIGIDLEEQERVFERFYRVDKSRNRKIISTGLGLAIVKHIVLSLGGEIELESELGKGTLITLKFKKRGIE